ncbi:MAG: hypothetical protein CML24_08970 [Rhizobiales bacterium]|nr:hypothetical protein [Hyphomicrobiales bacterium]
MMIQDRRDFLGGLLLLGAGSAIALYAATHYSLGTAQRMGPGMFPFGAGVIMALLGILVIIPAFLRRDASGWGKVPPRPLVFVLISIVCFALAIPHFGLAPAIAILVLISSLGDRRFNIINAVIVSVVMSLMSYLIFVVGLNLPFIMFRWSL